MSSETRVELPEPDEYGAYRWPDGSATYQTVEAIGIPWVARGPGGQVFRDPTGAVERFDGPAAAARALAAAGYGPAAASKAPGGPVAPPEGPGPAGPPFPAADDPGAVLDAYAAAVAACTGGDWGCRAGDRPLVVTPPPEVSVERILAGRDMPFTARAIAEFRSGHYVPAEEARANARLLVLAHDGPLLMTARRLYEAIRAHHGAKGDDRCWEDDDRLYAAAGLPAVDRRVGDKEAMLANCRRFVATRCAGGGWDSYVEVERQRDVLASKVARLGRDIEGLQLLADGLADEASRRKEQLEIVGNDLRKSRRAAGLLRAALLVILEPLTLDGDRAVIRDGPEFGRAVKAARIALEETGTRYEPRREGVADGPAA